MAIHWGEPLHNGFQGDQLGISVSWRDVDGGKVTNGTEKAEATVRYYDGVRADTNDEPTLHMTGSISGSHSFDRPHWGTNGDPEYHTHLIATRTYTYTYGSNEYGSSPSTRTFAANLTGTYNNLHPTVSVKSKVPERPYAKPATPGDASWSYQSDSKAKITWTRHSTAKAPYRSQQVMRYRWIKNNNAYDGGQVVAKLRGGTSSWTDTSIEADNIYYWVVRAGNNAGWSDWGGNAESTSMNTTPDAPSHVHAKVTSSGDAIRLTWSNETYRFHQVVYDIQRSVNGGSYAAYATTGNYATDWTDNDPGAGTNQYRVRARVTTGNTLSSGYVESNAVSTIVPPLAPIDLSPDGAALDASEDFTVSYTYRDGGDGADQTAVQARYSDDGGDSWTLGPVLTTDQTSFVMVGDTFDNGYNYLWQVRTQAVPSEGWGPWSDSATVTTSAKPVVAITSPGSTVTTGHLSVTWTYVQSEGKPQGLWRATLYTSDGETVVEVKGGVGDDTTTSFDYYGINTQSYVVEVVSISTVGVGSDSARQSFTVDVPDPAAVSLELSYDAATGEMLLDLEADDPATGEAEAVAATVERTADGGDTWVRLTEDQGLPFGLVDPLPNVSGENIYRITSISAEPAYRVNPTVPIVTPSGAYGPSLPTRLPFQLSSPRWMNESPGYIFVNYGSAFSQQVKVRSVPSISPTPARAKTTTALLGQRDPRASYGQNRSLALDVSALLVYDLPGLSNPSSSFEEWMQAEMESLTVCYRDPLGNRVFGQMSNVRLQVSIDRTASISFTITKDDSIEQYGQPT